MWNAKAENIWQKLNLFGKNQVHMSAFWKIHGWK